MKIHLVKGPELYHVIVDVQYVILVVSSKHGGLYIRDIVQCKLYFTEFAAKQVNVSLQNKGDMSLNFSAKPVGVF